MSMMENRTQFIESLKGKLDEWNTEIGRLEEKAKAASDDAKRRYEQQVEEMKRNMQEAERRLEDLRQTNDSNWDAQRKRFEEAWHDISAGFGRAWSRFF